MREVPYECEGIPVIDSARARCEGRDALGGRFRAAVAVEALGVAYLFGEIEATSSVRERSAELFLSHA